MGSLLDKALKVKEMLDESTPEKIIEKLEKTKEEAIDLVKELKSNKLVKQSVKQKDETVLQEVKKKLISSTPEQLKDYLKPKQSKKGRIFAFVGKHGTGKSFACCNLAKNFKKTLYLDTEYKVSEILDEQYPDLKYDMKEPIKDNKRKLSQIFKQNSDVHIDVVQVINPTTGKRDDVATVQYIIKTTPIYLQLIKSGKYKNFVIDSCSPIWIFAYKTWLKRNAPRVRPNKFEFGEIEAIKQDILLPIVNYCKIYSVNLILTFGIGGHYINDVMIGYKEDAKQWLLNIFSYELWFEYDYMKYCIKHPYKPFWAIQDEDLEIAEYLFDKEFIDNEVEFKEFEEFKYESMTSESYRAEAKKRDSSLHIG